MDLEWKNWKRNVSVLPRCFPHLLTISASYVRFEKIKYQYMSRKAITSTCSICSWIFTALIMTLIVRAEVGFAEQYLCPGYFEIGLCINEVCSALKNTECIEWDDETSFCL